MPPTLTEDKLRALQANASDCFDGDGPYADFETEHIYIGDENADPSHKPRTVNEKTRIRNIARGVTTELTFYDEGFLRLREGTAKELQKDHTIELRFLDDDMEVSRRVATAWLWTSILMGLVAGGAYLLLPLTDMAHLRFAATTLLGTLSAVAFLLFVYRSEEQLSFFTASGRAEVITLASSFGCISKVRRAAKGIRRRVSAARGNTGLHDVRYLRAEMQAHYKLRETGVISREACSEGTALILSKFG